MLGRPRKREQQAKVQATLCYLRDCYESDNRESGVANLFAEDVRHLHFPLMASELATGALDRVPIDPALAAAIRKDVELYRTEKSLILGAFFLIGRSRDRHESKVVAPLLLAPAQIEETGEYAFVRVDLDRLRANSRILARLLGESSEGTVDELAAALPQLPLAVGEVDQLARALTPAFPNLDANPLARYPDGFDEAELRALADRRNGALVLAPGIAIALVQNSPDTRAVLAELTAMAHSSELSAPLAALLTEEHTRHRRAPRQVALPAVLSGPQQRIVESTLSAPLTVIVGPPGTGKSYTLATVALAHALRGESVLIAAKTSQALDVVHDKIDELTGGGLLLIHTGDGRRDRELLARLDALLAGAPATGESRPDASAPNAGSVRRAARAWRRSERRLAHRLALEQRWGASLPPMPGAVAMSRLGALVAAWRLRRLAPCWELAARAHSAAEALGSAVASHVRTLLERRLERALLYHRHDLVALAKSLRARTARTHAQYFAAIDRSLLFATLPIWLTTLAAAGELVPLERELFDVVLIDEATQCDMASPLAVLQRGRRAAVTGDPMQLRHVSFLSDARLTEAAERHGVSTEELERLHYRNVSLLDLVLGSVRSQRHVIRLDEHFRSRPPIIEFSNRELYGGGLRVMTRRPSARPSEAMLLRRVAGNRDGRGINRVEVDTVAAEITTLVEQERALAASVSHSIGVLSPFRDQADAISARLARSLPVEAIEKHRVLVGTAHSFQGEERDLVWLSLALDTASHGGALRFLQRPDVFNVAITRARQLQTVVTSLDPTTLPPGLLARYLGHIVGIAQTEVALPPADAFLAEVQSALQATGFATWPRYRVAGHELDLVVERAGRVIGVDLIGSPGPLGAALAAADVRVLGRAGLRLFPLSLFAWRHDPAACLAALARWLE
jgi:hypothetical protein